MHRSGKSWYGRLQFTVGFNSDSLKVKGGTKLCQVKKKKKKMVGLMDKQPKSQMSGFNNAVED